MPSSTAASPAGRGGPCAPARAGAHAIARRQAMTIRFITRPARCRCRATLSGSPGEAGRLRQGYGGPPKLSAKVESLALHVLQRTMYTARVRARRFYTKDVGLSTTEATRDARIAARPAPAT